MTTTDLIIIGAGPGGYRAAEYAAKHGLKVTIFEGDNVGGTCLNVGCIPTKTYVHSASFAEARERMAQVVPQLRNGVEGILSHPNITLVREKASFVDAHTVSVGGDSVTAKNIIIATGSETKWLPIEGANDPCVVDSTGLLNLETLPKRLCIIGAGVIGMEFASVFRRFGSEVTVIEFLKECLPALDSDIAKRLRKQMEKEGITFHMQCGVKQIADGEVFFENKKGQTESVEADVVLMATGRKPRTEGLNLEALGITLASNGAIPVDDNFQLSTVNCQLSTVNCQLSTVYAVGDANGRQMLAHAAEMQAVRAVNHILGKQDAIRFDIMPAAIFTSPEAACVGPTEDQLKAAAVANGFAVGTPQPGAPYECRKAFWRANGKAMAMGETEGMLKLFHLPLTSDLLPHETPGLILGCHAYGAHSADIVQEVAALMCRGTTIQQLRDIIHIHPTLGEILKAATE
ncbi:MAG: NAD(P)/FAD-dependent oxidoreductase [Prevotella sp.]|jgi:dihydrolipoamide dehydrogenase|nr:NAD(P)/FAD-dependent oxidoreductase [Prevotella sp.]